MKLKSARKALKLKKKSLKNCIFFRMFRKNHKFSANFLQFLAYQISKSRFITFASPCRLIGFVFFTMMITGNDHFVRSAVENRKKKRAFDHNLTVTCDRGPTLFLNFLEAAVFFFLMKGSIFSRKKRNCPEVFGEAPLELATRQTINE